MVLGEDVRVLVTESMVELGVVEGKVSCETHAQAVSGSLIHWQHALPTAEVHHSHL
jgi:hypothetical protein